MKNVSRFAVLAVAAVISACSGGGGGQGGSFFLVEFLESGKDNIPRNRVLTFSFSQPVDTVQDFPERLKIENVITTPGNTNFSRAVGTYIPNADIVTFVPRLPTRPDRSDAGFRASASYHVFLKGGADALRSSGGDPLSKSSDLIFDTNTFFEDPVPASPPRALGLTATDPVSGAETPIGRLDPRPQFLALLDNATLLDNGRAIDPGAGGGPGYATPWEIDLRVSEPLDPTTVITQNVVMYEIRDDAFDGPTLPAGSNTVSDGHFGTAVNFKVPVNVTLLQSPNLAGGFDVFIRVSPLQTLVDDARYRLSFSGNILGIDFRKTFIGDNGLTGDGTSLVGGVPYVEVGGLGYVSEFLVFDRPAITRQRRLEYEPLVDSIQPEDGTTTTDPAKLNSALYNPAANPSRAVGFLSAFGDGRNGNLSATGGGTVIVNTGDTRNTPMGNPFTVQDLNPTNMYTGNPLPGGPLTYDTPTPFELQIENLTVSSASTLRFTGVNPVVLRVHSVVQIVGTVDVSGGNGQAGGGSVATAGTGGPGGYAGASTSQGMAQCSYYVGSCQEFSSYLTGCAAANAGFPFSRNGQGPGRGYAGGEVYNYYATDNKNGTTGTGGGGGSHATKGGIGEDIQNAGGTPGSSGPSCSITIQVRNSGVIGVRGQSGPTYGDRECKNILLGGSSGASGGSVHGYSFATINQAGGAGGGGGGSLTVISAGPIFSAGGRILARGGNGGKGAIKSYSAGGTFAWDSVSGGGGGGAGGLIALISGDDINLAAGLLDTSGGTGGARANSGTAVSCRNCNAGGEGGKGFIFLMDADGLITGFIPGSPGNYDSFATGILTISAFDASRFSTISAITRLFPSLAANPDYQAIAPSDIVGVVSAGQFVHLFMSSAKGDVDEPLLPDPTTESAEEEIALVSFSGGSTLVTIIGSMDALNPSGFPNRDSFVRVRASFEYTNGVEAALGPFAMMDSVTLTFTFNG